MNQIKIIKNNNKKGNKFSIQVSIKIKAALHAVQKLALKYSEAILLKINIKSVSL
jgi:hypothetical protein